MNHKINKKIAILDVDGTLFKGQIQQRLIIYFWKKKMIGTLYFIKLNIWFILYKLGICWDINAILNFGIKYLAGKPVSEIDLVIKDFIAKNVRDNIYPNSINLLNELRQKGYQLVILSSAIDVVIGKVAEILHVDDCICTVVEKNNGVYTGKICDTIIYGNKKLDAITDYFQKKGYSFENAVAYADHISDIPLLKSVGKGYIVNPNGKMCGVARSELIDIAYTI